MIIRIVIFIISIVLYLKSPNDYDFNFCFWCMILYLLEVGLLVGNEFKRGIFFSFNMIFFFSFFWTSFAYPVLLYDTPAGYLSIMIDHIDWSVLSHSTSLCLVFASSYCLGYGSANLSKINHVRNFKTTGGRSDLWLKVVFIFLICMAFVYLARAGFKYEDFSFDVALWDLYFVLLAFCLIEKSKFKTHNFSILEFYKLNKFPLLSSLFIIILFLTFGDRGPALKSFLVVAAIYYYYYKKIKIKHIVVTGLVGLVFMFIIRQTRGNYDLITVIANFDLIAQVLDLRNGLIYIFSDLYGASMELNVAYDYALHHDLFHPERILVMPLTAVPFLPTVILGLFGSSMETYNTGSELNRIMSEFGSKFGNHVVGDLFMSSGFWGVILFGLILGVVSKRLAAKRFENEMYAVAYLMLFSFALYLPRDTVFSLVRPICLSFIVLYFLLPKTKRK